MAFSVDDIFLGRVIAIMGFVILIILIIVSRKENSRTNLTSYVLAGLSVYALMDLIGGIFKISLFVPFGISVGPDMFLVTVGLAAAIFSILSKDKIYTTISLAIIGSISSIIGFFIFWFMTNGIPDKANSMFFPALIIWGCIYGIGISIIYKNIKIISILAGVSALGLLLSFLVTDEFVNFFSLSSYSPSILGFGICGGVLGAVVGTGMYYASVEREKLRIKSTSKDEHHLLIKRGYEVLPDNNIRFGIRVMNNSDAIISDVEVILDFTESLFELKGNNIQNLGTIPPDVPRTAKFILKPLGCIHKEEINTLIIYKDHLWNKHTEQMRPKEVHCVCPFLKGKLMNEGEYGRLVANSAFVQEGISFKGITVDDLAKFMGETCRHMLHKVSEYDIEGKKVIYLSGESVGEKAYYLLTAVIQEYKGLTQVLLRAHSDKKYGLNGFMNEMADSLRHLVGSVQNTKEIGIIENTQVINIIDSVVQRTNFEMGEGGSTQVNIRESVVQRTNIGDDQRKNEF